MRHLISISELGPDDLSRIIDLGLMIASGNIPEPKPLIGKTVGIYFRRPSTRTRTSFAVGAMKLGAGLIQYGPNDLQITTGETVPDTARVLSGFLDLLVIRTNETVEEMRSFASQDGMSVINAMSSSEHPTQAIADLITIHKEFGRLEGIHILYLGEGNNTTAALALAAGLTRGMRLTIVTPEGYGLTGSILEQAQVCAERNGSVVEQHHRMDSLPRCVDVVYTTRWQTMGEPKADRNWQAKFKPYQINEAVMAGVSKETTIFMHDLPAVRGSEVVDEVLDGPQSRAFQQARHKLTGAMSVLTWCAA